MKMSKKRAQILIEVIIGILIIGVAFGGGFLLISTALKSQKQSFKKDIARSLIQETQEILKVLAIEDWFNIYDKKESGKYHLEKSDGSFSIVAGEGTVNVGEESFTRYFEIEDLNDPLKVKVKITAKWEGGKVETETVISRYREEESWTQEDWSGGPVGEKVISFQESTTTFSTSSNIDYSSSGVIMLEMGGASSSIDHSTLTLSFSSSGDDQPGSGYGYSVSSGDFNGDGYDDLVVGAPSYDTANSNAGKVYVYYGSATGFSSTPDWTSVGDDQADAYYGYSVSSGDFNGDGYDDLVVGAETYDTANADAGKVYVYHGSSSGLSSTPAWTSSGDDQAASVYGCSVSSGDFNGDGYDDLVVGAETYDGVGKVYVYHGSSSGLSSTPAWTSVGDNQLGAEYGHAVFSGDFNGDGYDDLVVGAESYDDEINFKFDIGKVYVYHGSSSGLSGTPAWTSVGDNRDGAEYGYSVSSGDFNGDNYDDLVVGADEYKDIGKVYVYHGSSSGLSGTPAWTSVGDNQLGAMYGCSVFSGDVNNDDYSDLIVGAFGYDTANNDAGKAYLYHGSSSGLSTTTAWTSVGDDQARAFYGHAVCSGDFNGDSYFGIAVGAPGYNSNTGKVYVYEY